MPTGDQRADAEENKDPVAQEEKVVVGRLGAPHGVRGWLKLQSFTEPPDNITRYANWFMRVEGQIEGQRGKQIQWRPVEITALREQNKGYLVQLKGIDDRNQAQSLVNTLIGVERSDLPALPEDEYYWHQLLGMEVWSQTGETAKPSQLLGVVASFMETGANDVMVVTSCADSIDTRERLIPWLTDTVIVGIAIDEGRLTVDWDPEF